MVFQGSWTMVPVAAIIRALINTLYSHRKNTCFPLLFQMLLPGKDGRMPLTYRHGSWHYLPSLCLIARGHHLLITLHIFNMGPMEVLTVLTGISHLLCVDPVLECLNLDWNHREHPRDFCRSYSLKLGWSKCRLISVWCASIWANKDFSAAETEAPRCRDQSDRIKRPLCSSAIRAQQCQHQGEPCE